MYEAKAVADKSDRQIKMEKTPMWPPHKGSFDYGGRRAK